jgi:hypothetical protein
MSAKPNRPAEAPRTPITGQSGANFDVDLGHRLVIGKARDRGMRMERLFSGQLANASQPAAGNESDAVGEKP